MKQSLVSSIPFLIADQLGTPIRLIRFGQFAPGLAVMSMPEAAVNENNLASLGKHQIWVPRQVFAV